MTDTFKITISKELKNARNDAGLTLIQVRDLSGIAPSTICYYENASVKMSVDVILKLLEIYNINPTIFFERCIAKTQVK